MANKVKAIPDGYHSVTPYLFVQDAKSALDFYKKAFNAIEIVRMADPSGKINHAEIKIGDSNVMLADEFPEMQALSPRSVGGTPIFLHLYVEDVDTIFTNALKAGAKEQRAVADQFYGDRAGSLIDPFGHIWHIASHVEDLSPEEIQQRYEAWKAKGGCQG